MRGSARAAPRSSQPSTCRRMRPGAGSSRSRAGPPGGRDATARDAVLAFVMLDTYEPDLGVADDPALSPETRAMVRQALDDGGTMLQAGEEVDWAATLAELRPLNPTELPAVLLMTDPHQHYSGHEPAV